MSIGGGTAAGGQTGTGRSPTADRDSRPRGGEGRRWWCSPPKGGGTEGEIPSDNSTSCSSEQGERE